MNIEQVKSKIDEIYNILNSKNIDDISLMSGGSGCAIFQTYYQKHIFNDCEFFNVINNLHQMSNRTVEDLSYCIGYSGFLFTIKELEKTMNKKIVNSSYFKTLKSTLFHQMKVEFEKDNYELLYGAIGHGLILNEASLLSFNSLKSILKKKIIEIDSNMYTLNSIDIQGKNENNFGISHGIPAMITFLSICSFPDKDLKKREDIVLKLINYLQCHSFGYDDNGIYFYYNSNFSVKTNLAWCYGGLSIARSFFLASKAFDNEHLKKRSIEIMLKLSKVKNLGEIKDAGICHGTAGIAHIFNRFYKDTKMIEFKDATDYWIDQTLLMAKFEDGLAGFKAWQGIEIGWTNEYGLLEGIAGIGLVLLSYLNPEIEPTWDRCLLLS